MIILLLTQDLILPHFTAYYSQTAPPVELTQQNPLCRFKAIGYSCMPSSDNAEGLVALTFNKKEEEIRYEFPYIQTLHSVCVLCVVCLVYVLEVLGLLPPGAS
jgi:hypothetical protein